MATTLLNSRIAASFSLTTIEIVWLNAQISSIYSKIVIKIQKYFEVFLLQKNTFTNKFDEFSAWYNSSDAVCLRTIISATIPHVGGAINTFLTDRGAEIAKERLNLFCEKTTFHLNKLEEEKVDYAYLKSEVFYDLLFQCISKIVRLKNKEQIALIAYIFCKSISHNLNDIVSAEDLVNLIAELSFDEAIVLKMIADYTVNGHQDIDLVGNCLVNSNLENKMTGKLQFLLKRLESKGLIVYISSTPMMIGAPPPCYCLTEIGKNVIDLLLNSN